MVATEGHYLSQDAENTSARERRRRTHQHLFNGLFSRSSQVGGCLAGTDAIALMACDKDVNCRQCHSFAHPPLLVVSIGLKFYPGTPP